MSGTTDPGDKSAAQIEGEVERTRARVTETVEALRDRASPGQITEQVLDYVRSSGGTEFFRNLGASVRDNPLPVTLIGAGIAWLLVSGGNKGAGPVATGSGPYPYPERRPLGALPGPGITDTVSHTVGRAGVRVSDAAGDLRDRARDGIGAVGDAASRAADAAGDAASRVADAASGLAAGASAAVGRLVGTAGDAASRVADAGSDLAGRATGTTRALLHDASDTVSSGLGGAGEVAGRARGGWDRMMAEQPLLVGALGLAAGAALGALLPRTGTEDRLMGEQSDAVTGQAAAAAREGYERVKGVAAEHASRAGDALADTYVVAKDQLNREGPSVAAVGDALSKAVGEVTKVATDAAQSLAGEAKGGIDAAAGKADEVVGKAEPPRGAPAPAASAPTPSPAPPLAAPAIVPPRTTSGGTGPV